MLKIHIIIKKQSFAYFFKKIYDIDYQIFTCFYLVHKIFLITNLKKINATDCAKRYIMYIYHILNIMYPFLS